MPYLGMYASEQSHRPAGGLTRAEGQDRIDFLAQVRNAALEPLWRGGGNGNESAWGSEGGFKADRIVFINDVYFCARDIVGSQPHLLYQESFESSTGDRLQQTAAFWRQQCIND